MRDKALNVGGEPSGAVPRWTYGLRSDAHMPWGVAEALVRRPLAPKAEYPDRARPAMVAHAARSMDRFKLSLPWASDACPLQVSSVRSGTLAQVASDATLVRTGLRSHSHLRATRQAMAEVSLKSLSGCSRPRETPARTSKSQQIAWRRFSCTRRQTTCTSFTPMADPCTWHPKRARE